MMAGASNKGKICMIPAYAIVLVLYKVKGMLSGDCRKGRKGRTDREAY